MQIARIGRAGGLAACVGTRLDRVPLAHAHRGDVAGIEDETFGIRLMVIESPTLVGSGARGLIRMPRSTMVVAWSAG